MSVCVAVCKYIWDANAAYHLPTVNWAVFKCRRKIQVKDTFGFGPTKKAQFKEQNKRREGDSFWAINFKVNTLPQSHTKDLASILFDLRRADKRNNDNVSQD